MEFYRCKHCGNLVMMIHKSGVPMICCGEEMELLSENTVDAAVEKHVPAVTLDGNKIHVAVGSVAHPMIEAHYIQWIALETDKGVQIKYLHPNEEPTADFAIIENEQPLKVYEHCNLHGLWSATI